MKTIKNTALGALTLFLFACGGDKKVDSTTSTAETTTTESAAASAETPTGSGDASSYDPNRGIGKYDEGSVDVSKFDPAMAAEGKKIAEVKCTSCHKTTDEKLVGPGWKGVTTRHTPHWIMNFISNPDPMIDVDPEVQKQLELCLVRMPNQGLTDTEARQVLEYMREIDGANN